MIPRRCKPLVTTFAALTAVTAASALAQPAGPAPLPTLADIEAMYAAGEHRLTLQQISRILQGSPPAVRAQLFFIRAQALLQLEDPATARQALDMVEREAARSPEDPAIRSIAARARADRILIGLSRAGSVTLPGRDPVPLADTAARAELYRLLFEERLAALQPDLPQINSASDLPTLSAFLPRVFDVHSLEIAATGNDARTGEIYAALGTRARTLIDRELQLLGTRIAAIRDNASRTETFAGAAVTGTWWASTPIRRGLHSNDRQALRQILSDLTRILDVCEQARSYAISLGRTPQGWDDLITRTRVLGEQAQGVLDGE